MVRARKMIHLASCTAGLAPCVSFRYYGDNGAEEEDRQTEQGRGGPDLLALFSLQMDVYACSAHSLSIIWDYLIRSTIPP